MTNETQWEKPMEMNQGAAGDMRNGPPGANLFIGQIPDNWDDQELLQHFAPFGTVKTARVVRDEAGKSKNFGFVSYDNLHAAGNAIETMHRFRVEGRSLTVTRKKGEEHIGTASQEYQSFAQPTFAHPYVAAGSVQLGLRSGDKHDSIFREESKGPLFRVRLHRFVVAFSLCVPDGRSAAVERL